VCVLHHQFGVPHTYKYPRPALTVDCVIFGFREGTLEVLLIQRGIEPFKDRWALPGGFVHENEDIEAAARRELAEETNISGVFLEQLYTFGAPGRDPRGHVVSVAFFALVRPDQHPPEGATDASDAKWFPTVDIPPLAFDHSEILATALTRLRGKLRYQPIGFELLPNHFTLTEIQSLYEAILGRTIDKRNFRKKLLSFGFLIPLESYSTGPHRPARLHRFDKRKYQSLTKKGYDFEL